MQTHANPLTANNYNLEGGLNLTLLQADASFLSTEILRWKKTNPQDQLSQISVYPGEDIQRTHFSQEFAKLLWPDSRLGKISVSNTTEIALFRSLERLRSIAIDTGSKIYTEELTKDLPIRIINLFGALICHMRYQKSSVWKNDLDDAIHYTKTYLDLVEARSSELMREVYTQQPIRSG